MSDIEKLIETVKSESLKERLISVDLIDTIRDEGSGAFEMDTASLTRLMDIDYVLEEIKVTLDTISNGLFEFFSLEKERFDKESRARERDRRDLIEQIRESQGTLFADPESDAPTGDQTTPDNQKDQDGFSMPSLLTIGTAITAALSGYFVGLLKEIGSAFKSLGARVRNIIPTSIMNSIRGLSAGLVMQFDDLIDTVKNNKIFASIGQSFSNLVSNIKSFFAPLMNLRDTFSVREGGKIDKLLNGLKTGFNMFKSTLTTIFNGFVRLARPIALIIAAWNSITKSFEILGDDSMSIMDKLGNVINTVLTELTSAFVTMPIELVKKLISWVAGAFGFENVEKFLDSFDIDAMFREGMQVIGELVDKLLNYITDKLYEYTPDFLKDAFPGNRLDRETRIAERKMGDAADELLAFSGEEATMDNPEYATARKKYDEALEKFQALERVQQQRAADQQTVQLATTLDEETQKTSLDAAKKSRLYDKDGFVFGDSEIDKDVLAKTTDQNQLKAILNDNDLDEEDRKLVIQRLNELNGPNRQLPTTTSQEYAEAPPPPPPAKTDYSDVASYIIDQDDQVKTVSGQDEGETYTGVQAAKRAAEEQGLEAYRIEPVTEDDGFGEQVETGQYRLIAQSQDEKKVGGVVVARDGQPVPLTPEQVEQVQFANEMATITSESNQPYDVSVNPIVETATGDQISTVSNQTYMGVQAAKEAAEEQGLDAYRIEPVTEDDGFGEQVETGEYKVIPRQTVATGDQVSNVSKVVPLTSVDDMTSTESAQRVLSSVMQPLFGGAGPTTVEGDVNSLATSTMTGVLSTMSGGEGASDGSALASNVLGDQTSALATGAMTGVLASMFGQPTADTSESGDVDLPQLNIEARDYSDVSSFMTPTGGLAMAPVGEASKAVDAVKDQPNVIALSGGSSQNIQNNISNAQVHNYGSMSARSNDLSAQRLKDHMMA